MSRPRSALNLRTKAQLLSAVHEDAVFHILLRDIRAKSREVVTELILSERPGPPVTFLRRRKKVPTQQAISIIYADNSYRIEWVESTFRSDAPCARGRLIVTTSRDCT